jgi:hypothetical protein
MPLIGKPYPKNWILYLPIDQAIPHPPTPQTKSGRREKRNCGPWMWATEWAGLVGPVPSGGLVEPGRVPILTRACFPNTMGRGQFRNAIGGGLFQNTIGVHHSSFVRMTTVVPTVNASRHKWGKYVNHKWNQ